MTTATIIELGDISAGILVPESRGFRFFAAGSPFHRLEGASFGSIEQAKRAARALLRPGRSRERTERAEERSMSGPPTELSRENEALFSVFCGLTVPY